MSDQNLFQAPRDAEGPLSRWSQLHLQSLAPTPLHGEIMLHRSQLVGK
jgi:hypothetical protein